MKRTLVIFLFLLVSLVVVSCQGGDDDAAATAEARAAEAEAAAAAAEAEAAAASAARSEAEAAAAAAEAEASGFAAEAEAAAAAAAEAEAEAAEARAAAADAAAAAAAAEAELAAASLMEGCEVDLTGETITIHQHAGLVGPLAAITGDAFVSSTAEALRDINEAGGICGATLEVVFRETQYDPEQEIVAYEQARAADPKPFLILTYGSGATIALHERVIEDKIVNSAAGLNTQAIYIPRNGYTLAGNPVYSDQFAGFAQWLSQNWADVKPESAGDDIVIGVIGWAGPFGAGATTPEALDYIATLGNVTVLPLEEQPISPDADVSGQLQSLLLQGANVIYNQNLSFGTSQVVGTARALGIWDDIVMGGVNWTNNLDVIQFLSANAQLMDGYYAMYPHADWNDIDNPGVQQARAAFGRGGYPESDRNVTWLTGYAAIFTYAETIRLVIDEYGLEGLTGENYLAVTLEHSPINPLGIEGNTKLEGEDRAEDMSTIRRATWMGDHIQYVLVQDWFELPDTRPPAP